MGQRVVLGVSLAEAAGGVYTQGRERGRGGVCGRDYCRLGCWREGELSHGGIRVCGFGVHCRGHAVSAGACSVGGHVARA